MYRSAVQPMPHTSLLCVAGCDRATCHTAMS